MNTLIQPVHHHPSAWEPSAGASATPPPGPPPTPHLLLPQDEDSPRFDGMPGSQALPSALQLAALVGLPHPIPQGPADADVLPLVLWKG